MHTFIAVEKWKLNISRLLSVAFLISIFLPALHSLTHDISFVEDQDHQMHFSDLKTNTSCELCSFHFSTSNLPDFYTNTLHIPFKELVYTCSLEDRENKYLFRLFQLRAPPVTSC